MTRHIFLLSVFAIFLLHTGSPGASPSSIQEECIVRSERTLYLPNDSGFQEIAAYVDHMTRNSAARTGLKTAREPLNGEFEYIHVDASFDSCEAEIHSDYSPAKAGDPDCSWIGCQAVFPGNNMPIGSRMTISTCKNRVETTRKFKRVSQSSGGSSGSNGDNGIWELISYSTSAVAMCPSYQEP